MKSLFFVLVFMALAALVGFSTSTQADGWTDGGVMRDQCHQFAAVAGGVAALSDYQRGQLYIESDRLTEYKRGMIRDALTLVAAEKIRTPALGQSVALSLCSGHKKSGPSLWEWNIGVGWTGPY